MGYEVNITRATTWTESEQVPITEHEWMGLVAADPELRPDHDNGPPNALWLAHPSEASGIQFWWYRGAVRTKNPDQSTLRKMVEMAAVFGACVQGDDGERYTVADFDRPKDSTCG